MFLFISNEMKRLGLVPPLGFLNASRAEKYLLVHFGKSDLPGEPSLCHCYCCCCILHDTLFELKFHDLSSADMSRSDLLAVMVDSKGEARAIVAF